MSERKTRRKHLTLARRRALYQVAAAVAGVLAVYGVATAEQLAAILTLAGVLLGVTGMALANPTPDE